MSDNWAENPLYCDERLPRLKTIGDENWRKIVEQYRAENGGRFPNKRARNYLARKHGYELVNKKTNGRATDYMSKGATARDVRYSMSVMSYKGKRTTKDNAKKAPPLKRPETARG